MMTVGSGFKHNTLIALLFAGASVAPAAAVAGVPVCFDDGCVIFGVTSKTNKPVDEAVSFADGEWRLPRRAAVVEFGDSADTPVMGDWNGDGVDTLGVFRNGWWRLRDSNTAGLADYVVQFGDPYGTPVVGDWNGDGRDSIGTFRDGVWTLSDEISAEAPFVVTFGDPGDLPVVGDWDEDGVDTPGVNYKQRWRTFNDFATQEVTESTFGYPPTHRPAAAKFDSSRDAIAAVHFYTVPGLAKERTIIIIRPESW